MHKFKTPIASKVVLTDTAETILKKRYYGGQESCWEDLTSRCAGHIASTDEEYECFKGVMDRLDFLPNSPFLMNAGTDINAFSACYVLPIDDSINSIYKFYSDAALISKSGGGVGANYSNIRASGTRVNSTDGVASGPLSFMKVQDVSTDIIKQGGRRRGANMGLLNCDHADILNFIKAKDVPGVLENFNLSVGITDEFMGMAWMNGLEDSTEADLWGEICQRAWSSAEPGILFMDTIERGNTVPHLGRIEATNPCGEQPLLPYESCFTYDTLITTPNGTRKIGDLSTGGLVIGSDDMSHTFSSVSSLGFRPVVRVTTSNRGGFTCTPDHKVLLLDGSFCEAKDLVGKTVKILNKTPHTVEGGFYTKWETLGWSHGDGGYSGSVVGISFSSKDGDYEVKDKFVREFRDIFSIAEYNKGQTSTRYKTEGYSLYSEAATALGVAEELGMTPTKHKDIELPAVFYSLDDKGQRSFMRGLFGADGSLQGRRNNQIQLASNSEKMVAQVIDYLSSIGIHCRKFTSKFYTVKRSPQHKVVISKESAKRFMSMIGFSLSVKNDRFDWATLNSYRDEEGYEVISVEDAGEAEVFDINDVEDINTFYANGVAVHNCTLGSINLSNHVVSLGYGEADGEYRVPPEIDWFKLKNTVHTAVLFLNRVLDKSIMPIPECQAAMELTRKIGIGVMGLHDMLIQLSLPYDSEAGRAVAGGVMGFISEQANEASSNLGEKEGYYGGYKVNSPARRNANLTTIAPTGTLSMIADCSSGCEPYYAPVVYKTVLDGTEFAMPNKWVIPRMGEEGVVSFDGLSEVAKELFKGAEDIHWTDHIRMQAELQQYVDSSISKTINMPNSATVGDVKKAYELSWGLGLKGVTIYRNGSREAQVLSTTPVNTVEKRESVLSTPSKCELPDVLDAKRYRVKDKDGNKLYICVAHNSNGDPMEVFAKMPYKSSDIHWGSTCRMVSLGLRYGIPLHEMAKQLGKSSRDMFDIPAQLAKILKSYMTEKMSWKPQCPECGQEVTYESGCECCKCCGWSKCS